MLKSATLLVSMAIAVYLGYLVFERHRQIEFFEHANVGETTQSDAIAALGEPSKITDGIQFFDELSAKSSLVEGCTTEYWYEPPYAIQLLSFCFDKNGLLLHKYGWVSW